MSKRVVITSAAIIYTVAVALLSLLDISNSTPNIEIIGVDKLAHFCLYFILNLLLIMTFVAYSKVVILRWIVATTVASIIFGISLELIQDIVGRHFEIYDIVANSIGAISVMLLICIPKLQKILYNILN